MWNCPGRRTSAARTTTGDMSPSLADLSAQAHVDRGGLSVVPDLTVVLRKGFLLVLGYT